MFRPQLALAAILLLPVAAPAQTSQWQQDQKTESQVQQAVPVTGLPSIQSSVKNGVVTLTGTVRTEEDKARASQSLVNVPGIKMVMNNHHHRAAGPGSSTRQGDHACRRYDDSNSLDR